MDWPDINQYNPVRKFGDAYVDAVDKTLAPLRKPGAPAAPPPATPAPPPSGKPPGYAKGVSKVGPKTGPGQSKLKPKTGPTRMGMIKRGPASRT